MNHKVLVVDDSPTIQKVVEMALAKESIDVKSVDDTQSAEGCIEEFKPDLVLADINRPGGGGFDLSLMIKEKLPQVRVLLLSSDFEEFDEDRYQDSLADDHITKPFKSEDLVKKIKSLLSLPEEDLPPTDEEGAPVAHETPETEGIENEEETNSAKKDKPEPLSLSFDDLLDEDEDSLDAAYDAAVSSDTDDDFDWESQMSDGSPDENSVNLSEKDLAPAEQLDTPNEMNLESDDTTDKTVPKDQETQASEAPISEENAPAEEIQTSDETEVEESVEPVSEENISSLEEEDIFTTSEDISDVTMSLPLDESEGNTEQMLDEVLHTIDSFSDPETFKIQEKEESVDLGLDSSDSFGAESSVTDAFEDLDETFHTLQGKDPLLDSELLKPESESALSSMDPQTKSFEQIEPNVVQETLTFLSQVGLTQSGSMNQDPPTEKSPPPGLSASTKGTPFEKVVSEHTLNILKQSLPQTLRGEIAGLSDIVQQTVREVVRDMAPAIIRDVIQEEIKNLRDTKRH